MAEIEDKTIDDGRFIRPNEVESSAFVIVIGAELREKFFPGKDPIDKMIKIAGHPMRIVGVEQKRGSMFGQSLDNHAYIPITTYGPSSAACRACKYMAKQGTAICFREHSTKAG